MIGRLQSIVFDCPDPVALAEFYRGVLGGRVDIDPDEQGPEGDGWVDLHLASSGPRLSFQRSLGYFPPAWPGEHGEQQLHLDIEADDLAEAGRRAQALGARLAQERDGFSIYLDPVGHPFCIIAASTA